MNVNNETGEYCLNKAIQNSLIENSALYIQYGAPYEKMKMNHLPPFMQSFLKPYLEKREIEKEKTQLESKLDSENVNLNAHKIKL
jgi:hypothetical protein